MRIVRPCLSLFLLSILFNAAPASAQFDSGTVVGTVRDTSGAVVPGAKVTLTSAETGISVEQDLQRRRQLRVSGSRSRASTWSPPRRPASRVALVDNVQVQVGARLRVDLQMPVGQVTEKVEVTRLVAAASRPIRASAAR